MERVGNKVPHPAVIFVILMGIVIVLSHILYLAGASVSYEVINPDTHKIEKATTAARSLLTVDGIRFMFTGVVQNFMNFQAVGVIIVAMVGVGVAEASGLVNALIRKLVVVAPAVGPDLHPRGGRNPVEPRRGRRLPRADPAGRGRLHQRRAAIRWPGWPRRVRRRWPACSW